MESANLSKGKQLWQNQVSVSPQILKNVQETDNNR